MPCCSLGAADAASLKPIFAWMKLVRTSKQVTPYLAPSELRQKCRLETAAKEAAWKWRQRGRLEVAPKRPPARTRCRYGWMKHPHDEATPAVMTMVQSAREERRLK